jgi:ribosome recycling factor
VIDETLLDAEEKMEKAVTVAKDDFGSIRTGRATPAMFNKILVDYYGALTPVNQLASLAVPEPRMAVVQPYDKGSLQAIETAIRNSDLGVNPTNDGSMIRIVFPQLSQERRKDLIKVAKTKAEDAKIAIRNSDLGVNPTNDGSMIRIVFPQLSQERRKDLIKVAKTKAEDAKIAIRNIRRKAKDELDRMMKDGETGEDDVVRAEKELDKLTGQYVGSVDELLKHKEAELLEV